MGNTFMISAGAVTAACLGSYAAGVFSGHAATVIAVRERMKRKMMRVFTGATGANAHEVHAVLAATWLAKAHKDTKENKRKMKWQKAATVAAGSRARAHSIAPAAGAIPFPATGAQAAPAAGAIPFPAGGAQAAPAAGAIPFPAAGAPAAGAHEIEIVVHAAVEMDHVGGAALPLPVGGAVLPLPRGLYWWW